jgi:hypothetical protein
MSSFVEARVVAARGLRYLKLDLRGRWGKKMRNAKFKKHYGQDAVTLGAEWYDLCHTSIKKAKLTKKQIDRGFKMFLIAHYFLWNYSRNADQLSDHFDVCLDYACGRDLWGWIERISALQGDVIFWPKYLDRDETKVLALSADGLDKRAREEKHQTKEFNIDKKNFTKKHHHGGYKYQLVLAAQEQQCVHIYGPVRGGMGDKEMLARSGVLKRLKKGKLCVVDRGYIDKKWKDKLAWPNLQDSKRANNMKSRIRLRHESFNGKVTQYGTMCQTWRHTKKQHGLAFRAIVVTIQYALNDGTATLFKA